jgi:hypothetical protein
MVGARKAAAALCWMDDLRCIRWMWLGKFCCRPDGLRTIGERRTVGSQSVAPRLLAAARSGLAEQRCLQNNPSYESLQKIRPMSLAT